MTYSSRFPSQVCFRASICQEQFPRASDIEADIKKQEESAVKAPGLKLWMWYLDVLGTAQLGNRAILSRY